MAPPPPTVFGKVLRNNDLGPDLGWGVSGRELYSQRNCGVGDGLAGG